MAGPLGLGPPVTSRISVVRVGDGVFRRSQSDHGYQPHLLSWRKNRFAGVNLLTAGQRRRSGGYDQNPRISRSVRATMLVRKPQFVRIVVQAISNEVDRILESDTNGSSPDAPSILSSWLRPVSEKDIERCQTTLSLHDARGRPRLWARVCPVAQQLIAIGHQVCTDQSYADRPPFQEQ